MRSSSILALALLLPLLASPALGAPADDPRPIVPASEILAKIERGEPVEYDGVIVVGDLDLSGRTLEAVHFNNTTFEGSVDFEGVNFTGDTWFLRANFSGAIADFRGGEFSGDANFEGAEFSGDADFREANFGGDAYFWEANFGGDAHFREANFGGDADFGSAWFSGDADFNRANFSGDADFGSAWFSGDAYFAWAKFSSNADFGSAGFRGAAYIKEAEFSGDAYFGSAEFRGGACFKEANFSGDADFGWAKFRGGAPFEWVEFSGENADFTGAKFSGDADFVRVEFSGGDADFGNTQFSETVTFEFSIFNRSNLTLKDAKIYIIKLSDVNFKNRSTICLNGTNYERLYVHWDSIKDALVYNGEVYLTLVRNFKAIEYFEDADDCYYQYRRERQSMRSWGEWAKYTDILGWVTCGYGVRPGYTLLLGLFVVLVSAVYYWRRDAIRRLKGDEEGSAKFSDAFYFSMMTFTTVGYGDWYPLDRHRKVVMIEGIVGWLTLSLFLVTLANVIIR